MFNKFVTFLFISLFSLFSCSPPQAQPNPQSFEQEQAKSATQQNQLTDQYFESDIYSTYLSVSALNHLDVDIENQDKVNFVSFLTESYQDGYFDDRLLIHDTIGAIYFAQMTLDYLGTSDSTQSKLLSETISSLQTPNGYYLPSELFMEQYNNSSEIERRSEIAPAHIATTYQALKSLELIGEYPENDAITLEWLESTWDVKIHDIDTTPSMLHFLTESMLILSPDNPKLDTTWTETLKRVELIYSGQEPKKDFYLMDIAAATRTARLFNISPESWRNDAFIDSIIAQQNEDGGFNLALNGSSDSVGNWLVSEIVEYFDVELERKADLVELIKSTREDGKGFWYLDEHIIQIPK